MMRFVSTVLAVLLLFSARASAEPWCGASDEQNWKEFASTFWAGPRGQNGRPVMYVLAAPWCPYCAQIFKATSSKRYSFDVRFIPGHASSEVHRDQIADMVTDGTEQSLARVYVQRTSAKGGYTESQRAFIDEVQQVSDEALKARFGANVNPWGTPMSFILLGGKLTLVRGMPNLEYLQELSPQLAASEVRSPALQFAKSGIGRDSAINGVPYAKKENVKLRILPNDNALGVVCIPKAGIGFRAPAGLVTIEGKDWLVFRPFRPGTHLRVYGRADDFAGWKR